MLDYIHHNFYGNFFCFVEEYWDEALLLFVGKGESMLTEYASQKLADFVFEVQTANKILKDWLDILNIALKSSLLNYYYLVQYQVHYLIRLHKNIKSRLNNQISNWECGPRIPPQFSASSHLKSIARSCGLEAWKFYLHQLPICFSGPVQDSGVDL